MLKASGSELLRLLRPRRGNLPVYHVGLFVAVVAIWKVMTVTGLLAPFFFGDPLLVFDTIVKWFASGQIYRHLWITLAETMMAFAGGTALGLATGLWLALNPTASALSAPYIKGFNSMPRVILAPIFSVWFGLGMTSKVALGMTLVFFVVFFNVYQGVREVNPVILANARMLGMNERQLLRHVYWPAALSWVFSSLHTSVGFALVGAVVGEYLGASAGLGYLIAQAEGVFDVAGVFSGMLILSIFVVLIDGIVSLVEKQLLEWRPTHEINTQV